MRTSLRKFVTVALIAAIALLIPARAHAAEVITIGDGPYDVWFACGETVDDGQQMCVMVASPIYWGGGGPSIDVGNGVILLVFVLVGLNYAMIEGMINAGNPPPPDCYNCQESFLRGLHVTAPAQ